jgi:hypothetical protein
MKITSNAITDFGDSMPKVSGIVTMACGIVP